MKHKNFNRLLSMQLAVATGGVSEQEYGWYPGREQLELHQQHRPERYRLLRQLGPVGGLAQQGPHAAGVQPKPPDYGGVR